MVRHSLRQATQGDFAFLYNLHIATMKEYVTETWGWDEAFQEQYFREHFNPAAKQIIQVGGMDAGAVSVEVRPSEFFLAEIEVAPLLQRQGIGSAVIQDYLNEARAAGVAMTLQVLKVNPARRLYERLGFVVTGETSSHYLMRSSA